MSATKNSVIPSWEIRAKDTLLRLGRVTQASNARVSGTCGARVTGPHSFPSRSRARRRCSGRSHEQTEEPKVSAMFIFGEAYMHCVPSVQTMRSAVIHRICSAQFVIPSIKRFKGYWKSFKETKKKHAQNHYGCSLASTPCQGIPNGKRACLPVSDPSKRMLLPSEHYLTRYSPSIRA